MKEDSRNEMQSRMSMRCLNCQSVTFCLCSNWLLPQCSLSADAKRGRAKSHSGDEEGILIGDQHLLGTGWSLGMGVDRGTWHYGVPGYALAVCTPGGLACH